jgi:hypothetical protein
VKDKGSTTLPSHGAEELPACVNDLDEHDACSVEEVNSRLIGGTGPKAVAKVEQLLRLGRPSDLSGDHAPGDHHDREYEKRSDRNEHALSVDRIAPQPRPPAPRGRSAHVEAVVRWSRVACRKTAHLDTLFALLGGVEVARDDQIDNLGAGLISSSQ